MSSFHNAIDAYKNFDEFLGSIMQHEDLDVELHLTGSNNPIVDIKVNDTLTQVALNQGSNVLNFKDVCGSDNNIALSLVNKNNKDTIIDNNGNIVNDKFVLIDKFIINDVDIFTDDEFFYNVPTYSVGEEVLDISKPGFWHNAKLELDFKGPFTSYYLQNSTHTHWHPTAHSDFSYLFNDVETLLDRLK